MEIQAQGGPDGRLSVQFHMGTIEDVSARKANGYKVFKDVPWVRIMVPGERDVYHQPAWIDDSESPHMAAHNVRFPVQWARFRQGHLEQSPGFPLAEWPQCLRSQVEMLANLKIRTVEQLAAVSDGGLHNLGPGFMQLRQKAQGFLKQRETDAPMEKVREELATRDSEIALLKAQMAQVMAASSANAEALGDSPKRRGRPAKEQQDSIEG